MAGLRPPAGAIARLVKSVDFERVLGRRSRVGSAHFALHHLPPADVLATELSTTGGQAGSHPVDDLSIEVPAAEASCLLGAVVPKRHARRAVTRSLLKRQIYSVAALHLGNARGIWVVRLRAPFARAEFPSAASEALRRCVRAELDALFAQHRVSREPA